MRRNSSFSRNPVTIRLNSPITHRIRRPAATDLHVEPTASRQILAHLHRLQPATDQERGKQCVLAVTPTKMPNNCGLVPGDGGAKATAAAIRSTNNAHAHESPHPQRDQPYSFQAIRPCVLKERKQTPMTRQLRSERGFCIVAWIEK